MPAYPFSVFSIPSNPTFIEPIAVLVALALFAYLLFTKNPVKLTAQRMARMYLYLFLFLGIFMSFIGLTFIISGTLSMLFSVNNYDYPRDLPAVYNTDDSGTFSDILPSTALPPDMPTNEFMPFNKIANQQGLRELVYGVATFLLGGIISIIHFVVLQSIEKKSKGTLLRKVFIGSGMLLFGVISLSALLGLVSDLSYSAIGSTQDYSLVANLAKSIAALPLWGIFAFLGYQMYEKKELD